MNTAIQRQTDRRKVYRYIYDHPQPVTAWEIGEELSLEAPVVSSSLAGLLEEGMVTRLEDETYVLDPLARVAAGLCMLDDRVQLLAIDLRGEELGVGIAMPAIMDQAEGRLVISPTLELQDIPLEEIYCHFSRYPVFIENTPNASGYAERWAGGVRTNAVYLSLDRGVGGAILLGNEHYMGDHGRGGEFGHVCLVPNGRPCH